MSSEQERAVERWLADTPSKTIEGYCNFIDPTDEQIVREELAKPINHSDPGAGGPGLPQDVINAIIECQKNRQIKLFNWSTSKFINKSK